MGRSVVHLRAAKEKMRRTRSHASLRGLLEESDAGILRDVLVITRDFAERRRILGLGEIEGDKDAIIALLTQTIHDLCAGDGAMIKEN